MVVTHFIMYIILHQAEARSLVSFTSGGQAIYFVILHQAEARSLVSFTSGGLAFYYVILQPGGKELGKFHQWWARILVCNPAARRKGVW